MNNIWILNKHTNLEHFHNNMQLAPSLTLCEPEILRISKFRKKCSACLEIVNNINNSKSFSF
jgi:hypothetical protein